MKKLLILCPHCPGWPEWPVGMAYVLASLDRHGIPFEFLDLTSTREWEAVVRRRLDSQEYLAVATGGIIGFHRFFQRLAQLVRQASPHTPLILGGNITKDADDQLLFETIGATFGILGEAETSFPQFLRLLDAGETAFEGVPGVIFHDSAGLVVRNPPVRLDVALYDAFPAWHHFDWRFYVANSSFSFIGRDLRFMPILSGRGCVGKCGFCSPTIGGFRKRPIAQVIAEIRHLIATYEFDTLCFLNEMFYPTAREIREFCLAYREVEDRKPWFVQVRIDANLDVETLRLMQATGCIAVSTGIESGSDKVLQTMNKKTSTAQIRAFFGNCRQVGLPASGTYIVGYQDETEQDIAATIDLLIDEDINSGEAMLFVYQGTQVYREALARGLIADEVAHLDALSGNLFGPDAFLDFINLTAMPTREFFAVASREVRRFNTHLFRTNGVLNITRATKRGTRWTHCELSGLCRHCDAPLRHGFTLFGRSYLGFLGVGINRTQICPKCRRPVGWDVLAAKGMEEQQAHVRRLQEELSRHERIVVCGANNDLDFLLRIDLLGLDYSKIVGVHPYERSPHSWYLNHPVLNAEQVADLRPDCLLTLDPFQNTAALQRRIRDLGAPEPVILALPSEECARRLWREASLAARVFRALRRCLGESALDILRFIRRLGQA